MGRKGFAALIASIAVLAWGPSSASAVPQWSDGPVERSYVTNCPSIIFGSPYVEEGAWMWTGQYLDPGNLPNLNEVFYVHVVVGGVGNPCPGGQYAHLELLGLGGGNQLGYNSNYPIFCYAINWNTNPPSAVQEPAYGSGGTCPQGDSGPHYGTNSLALDSKTGPSSSQPWPFTQGRGWEIQIPVQSSIPLSGEFGGPPNCEHCNYFLTYIIDGNYSPILYPHQGLFVENVAGAGGGANPGAGGTTGAGGGLTPNPQKPAPLSATAPTGKRAAALKKCKKKKGAKRKKCKKRALKLPV